MGLNGFVRADGHPKTAMTTMLLGCIINIILDPIFIYGFGWGMFGAAFATIIGQFASSIWILSHFLSKRATYKLEFKNLKLNMKYIARITVLGLSAFIFHMAGSLMALVLNRRLLEYGGDIAVSGMGIINSVTMFAILPVLGLVQGASPIISYNYGARNKKRILSTVKLCMIISTIIMIAALIFTIFFSEQIVQMFNDEAELIDFTSRALIIWFLGLPVVGMQITMSNYFQSIGRYKISIFLTLIRQVIILIPMIMLLSEIWKLDGALYASPVSDILGFTLTASFFIYEYRRKYRKPKEVEV